MTEGLKMWLDLIRAKKKEYCHSTERRKIMKQETVADNRIKWPDWEFRGKTQFQLQKTRRVQRKADIEGKREGKKFQKCSFIIKYLKYPIYPLFNTIKRTYFGFKIVFDV